MGVARITTARDIDAERARGKESGRADARVRGER
jgi:hypothetical protein